MALRPCHRVELVFVIPVKFAPALEHRHEEPRLAHVTHLGNIGLKAIDLIAHVQVHHALENRATLAEVLELKLFTREQALEDVGVLELRSYRFPLIARKRPSLVLLKGDRSLSS